jgi:hypothetical protein
MFTLSARSFLHDRIQSQKVPDLPMSEDWPNASVIDDYIDHELDRLFGTFPEDVREQFGECARALFHGHTTFEDAQQVFFSNSAGDALVHKVQQILDVGDTPLPAPADVAVFAPSGSRRKSYPWTDAEDTRLLVAVSRFGAKDWRLIAEFVGARRNSSQCNQRWCRALDPAISHKPWSEGDDHKLLRAVEVLGKASWCQIAKIMTGRTDLQCRYRYLQLAKVTEVQAEKVEQQQPPGQIEQIAKQRRNSISIAPFTGEIDIEKINSASPSSFTLPYYLESSLTPRDDQNPLYLHRVPPLLFLRSPKK